MKIFTQDPKTTLINWRHFLGTILTFALMMPATVLSQSSPAPVELGVSGNFLILAKAGISTTGTTLITGDIGVSPIDHTAITGFDLILDPSGQYSTSPMVVGKIYAADYASPTPTTLSTAVSNMETAYTDAAGRTPDYTELYAGDLTGQTLTTGVYKWSTGILVSAGGVTISGSPTDVWIFQIAQDLIIANLASINLIGGAQASNIFWQVAGGVTLGTSSDFKGIILCQTQIAIQTEAAFEGKALAQTAVTLQANSVIPVELISFSATSINNNVILSWSTATETNNQGFKVQRRNINQAEYEEVGFVNGGGTTTELKSYSFTNENVPVGNYAYRLIQTDFGGTRNESSEVFVEVVNSGPDNYSLSQNNPNPFNPSTNIQYTLGESGMVSLKIYSLLGNEIVTLVNEYQNAGSYTLLFNTSQVKFNLTSGVYFYRLESGSFISSKKLILMK